jgi:hypothetical protein
MSSTAYIRPLLNELFAKHTNHKILRYEPPWWVTCKYTHTHTHTHQILRNITFKNVNHYVYILASHEKCTSILVVADCLQTLLTD